MHPAPVPLTRNALTLLIVALTALVSLAATDDAGDGDGKPPGSPPFATAPAVEGFLVAPYLQHPGPDRMTVMFEPEASAIGPDMAVEYRPAGETDWTRVVAVPEPPPVNDAAGSLPAGTPTLDVFRADLTGLTSNTVHEYRVVTASGTTPAAQFKTWPADGDGVDRGRFIVVSDIQGDHLAEQWFPRVLQAVIDHECDGRPALCVRTIDGLIVAGDLVGRGADIGDWRDEYFGPGDVLFRYLPQIPAMGNHDTPMEHYLYYFAPPSNGDPGFEEEWYALDFLNLRLLTLQSNFTGARLAERYAHQVAWIDQQLADAETGESDYVFANVHAPCQSELWLPGESPQVCDFVGQLEGWSGRTGNISGHLFGHTHGYSRGQSRDVSHLWLNVASAGGGIDDWGDFEMADYDEFETTWDEYGYVLFEVATTGTPQVSLLRHTGGGDQAQHPQAFTDAAVRDDITIGGDNTPPATPVAELPATSPVRTADVVLHAPFDDPDGDALLESHWQVRPAAGTYDDPLFDVWGSETRAHNVWFREDLNAGIDNDHWRVPYLEAGDYCWRTRFRDEHWAWSGWSDEACFVVRDTTTSPNLLTNGDAETPTGQATTEGWTVDEGVLQSVTGTECSAVDNAEISLTPVPILAPAEGTRFFSVGGCSGEVADRAVAHQRIDVSAFAAAIDEGRALGVLEAAVRTYSKWDVASVRFRALDAQGRERDVSVPLVNQSDSWERRPTSALLPPGTRSVEVLLTGLRQQGSSNDSFVDGVAFRIVTSPIVRESFAGPLMSPGNGMGLIPDEGWFLPRPHQGAATAPSTPPG